MPHGLSYNGFELLEFFVQGRLGNDRGLAYVLLLCFGIPALRSSLFCPSSGPNIFDMLAAFGAAAGQVEQSKELQPSDSSYVTVSLSWCPLSGLQESVYLLIEGLAMRKTMLTFGRW